MRAIVFWSFFVISGIYSLILLLIYKIFNVKNSDRKFFKVFLSRFTKISFKMLNVNIIIHNKSGIPDEELPNITKKLIVSNHASLFDVFALFYVFNKGGISFVSKKENSKIPIINSWMKSQHTFNIDREDIRGSIKLFNEIAKFINKSGNNVVIFPQGTRNQNTVDFKPGSLKIAQKAKVGILPIGLKRTHEIMGKKFSYRKINLEIYINEIIEYEEYKDQKLIDVQAKIQKTIFEQTSTKNE